MTRSANPSEASYRESGFVLSPKAVASQGLNCFLPRAGFERCRNDARVTLAPNPFFVNPIQLHPSALCACPSGDARMGTWIPIRRTSKGGFSGDLDSLYKVSQREPDVAPGGRPRPRVHE